MDTAAKDLKYYKRLPYTLRWEPIVDPEDGNYWLAWYDELPGCKTEGDTEAEAIANVQELFDEYITVRIDDREAIPEPARPQGVPLAPGWIFVPQEKMNRLPRSEKGPAFDETASVGVPSPISRELVDAA